MIALDDLCGSVLPAVRRVGMASLATALAGCLACAPRARAADKPSHTGPARDTASAADTASTTSSSAPPLEQRVAPALDPDPQGGPCAGYSFDGVAIGMARSLVEQTTPLRLVPGEEAPIAGFEQATYAFRAARPGRIDDVELGVGAPPTATVERVHARILVAKEDAWPRVLFDRLGKPKQARVGEWIWYDTTCGVTLRLTRMEALGESRGESYSLDIRRTVTRPPE